MAAESRPDWLPEGWTAVAKTTRSGAVLWCFHDPYTGSRFCSKKEVLQHLKSGKFCGSPTKQTRSITTRSMEKLCASANLEEENKTNSAKNDQIENTPYELPNGWIKEIRLRNSGTKIKKDPFYFDPVSGYEFRSLKDVFRYIETGDIHSCANKPKKRSIDDIHSLEKESHPPAAKRVEYRGTTVKKCLFPGVRNNSDVKVVTEVNGYPERSQFHPARAIETSVGEADSGSLTLVNIKHLDRGDVAEIKIDPELNSLQQELKVSGEVLETALEGNLLERKNLVLKEKEQMESKKPKRKRVNGSRKNQSTRIITMPHRASPRLAALRANTLVNTVLVEESHGTETYQVYSSSQDHSTKSTPAVDQQEMLPGVDFKHSKKLESNDYLGEEATLENLVGLEEKSKDKPVSQLTSPFGDSWPDPCIEFAFRTLIGDIPVSENTVVFQEYPQQQQMSSAISQSSRSSDALTLGGSGTVNQTMHLCRLEPPNKNNHVLSFGDGTRPCFLDKSLQSTKKLEVLLKWSLLLARAIGLARLLF
ncbi:hypothetical protein OPV22_005729 [Ensete ventricosum]|uniref:MBD domain-containing protein n=1 Tax=Ensete ventricosum TaxID=4639 RepID=A0AAV8RHA1_ENSVE|nr:hypothetical protein OPV22_005729 [Ensete ventricosum]